MYDLHYLPDILATAGLVGQPSTVPVLNEWTDFLIRETNIRLRRNRKRSLSDTDEFDSVSQTPQPLEETTSVSASGAQSGSVSGAHGSRISNNRLLDLDGNDLSDSHQPHSLDTVPFMDLVWPVQGTPPLVSSQALVHVSQGQGDQARQPDPNSNTDADILGYLRSLSHEELVMLALRQNRQIKSLQGKHATEAKSHKKTKRLAGQTARRLRQRIAKSKETVNLMKQPVLDNLDVFRGKSSYLTWRGCISLGLRKSIALASASTFPQASLLAVSRNTVTRSEHLVDSLLITRAVIFNKMVLATLMKINELGGSHHQLHSGEEDIPDESNLAIVARSADRSGPSGGNILSHDDAISIDLGLPVLSDPARSLVSLHPFGNKRLYLAATFWSGDATNSAIWQRQKLVGMLTNNVFLVNWKALQMGDCAQAFRHVKAMQLECIAIVDLYL